MIKEKMFRVGAAGLAATTIASAGLASVAPSAHAAVGLVYLNTMVPIIADISDSSGSRHITLTNNDTYDYEVTLKLYDQGNVVSSTTIRSGSWTYPNYYAATLTVAQDLHNMTTINKSKWNIGAYGNPNNLYYGSAS